MVIMVLIVNHVLPLRDVAIATSGIPTGSNSELASLEYTLPRPSNTTTVSQAAEMAIGIHFNIATIAIAAPMVVRSLSVLGNSAQPREEG